MWYTREEGGRHSRRGWRGPSIPWWAYRGRNSTPTMVHPLTYPDIQHPPWYTLSHTRVINTLRYIPPWVINTLSIYHPRVYRTLRLSHSRVYHTLRLSHPRVYLSGRCIPRGVPLRTVYTTGCNSQVVYMLPVNLRVVYMLPVNLRVWLRPVHTSGCG